MPSAAHWLSALWCPASVQTCPVLSLTLPFSALESSDCSPLSLATSMARWGQSQGPPAVPTAACCLGTAGRLPAGGMGQLVVMLLRGSSTWARRRPHARGQDAEPRGAPGRGARNCLGSSPVNPSTGCVPEIRAGRIQARAPWGRLKPGPVLCKLPPRPPSSRSDHIPPEAACFFSRPQSAVLALWLLPIRPPPPRLCRAASNLCSQQSPQRLLLSVPSHPSKRCCGGNGSE